MQFKKSIKGKRVWGVMKEGDNEPICIDVNRERAESSLDSRYTILVEMEITKAYTRNPEFVEIVI